MRRPLAHRTWPGGASWRQHGGARFERGSHTLDNPEPVHIDIICHTAGLTTAAYSFGYVAGWSAGDPKIIKATAERVVTCARDILNQAGVLAPTDQRQAA